ncbi:UNVERIFIED_ORG: hypothetical protein DFO49_1163 [Herbaspirillum seropedicae]
MKRMTFSIFLAFFVPCATVATDIEKKKIALVKAVPASGRVKKANIKIGAILREITLPPPGAHRPSFSVAQTNWGDVQILALTLDARGRIPSIAYYGITKTSICFLGNHAPLMLDTQTRLLVEVLYDSASKQIINRYTYQECQIRLHDQLIDQAIDTQSADNIRRSVTRVTTDAAQQPTCEYEIRQGKPVGEDACFGF